MNKKSAYLVSAIIILVVATGCAAGAAPPVVGQAGEPAADPVEAPPVQADTAPDAQDESADTAAQETNSDAEPPAASSILDGFGAPITAAGNILIVSGRVLDVNGNPLAGAAVEFWQTDASGVYDHPGDPGTNSRDTGFQFYGTSITDAGGNYSFRTLLPGRYEPRPPHIHVKVRLNGTELLTTQFYFAEDGTTGGVGGGIENLLMTLEQDTASDGSLVNVATFDVVVDTGLGSGTFRLTDSQGEGPYYPVVDVSNYDNDLASVEG